MSDYSKEIEIQRRYYTETADQYNSMHMDGDGEHFFALSFLAAALNYLQIESILDVGSGTGRTLLYLKKACPQIKIVGIEPVAALREIGYSSGLSENELIDGDATNIAFENQEYDLVCSFGVLHHIKHPEIAVAEMLRVSKKSIFISDSNNFGEGATIPRLIKHTINFLGLWKIVDLLKTKGKGYSFSEGDGVAYSYSIFNNYRQIENQCKSIHLLNTSDGRTDLYKTASHVALLGIRK